MPYTGNPAASTRDAVYFLIGETNTGEAQVSDAEIDYALAVENSVYGAAARMCEMLAAKWARRDGMSASAVTSQKQAVSKQYLVMARLFRAKVPRSVFYIAPGITKTHFDSNVDDTDIRQPVFSRGMHSFDGGDNDEDMADV